MENIKTLLGFPVKFEEIEGLPKTTEPILFGDIPNSYSLSCKVGDLLPADTWRDDGSGIYRVEANPGNVRPGTFEAEMAGRFILEFVKQPDGQWLFAKSEKI